MGGSEILLLIACTHLCKRGMCDDHRVAAFLLVIRFVRLGKPFWGDLWYGLSAYICTGATLDVLTGEL